MPVTIGGLPEAQVPLTGNELMEIEQNGISVRTTPNAFAGVLFDAPFIMEAPSGAANNERVLAVEAGVLSRDDGGPGNDLTLGIVDGGLANVKLADMAQATVKGRANAAGGGVPVDLSAAQLSAILGTVPHNFQNLILSDSEAIDLTDVGNALNIGASNPATASHLAFDASSLQAKGNATTAAAITINELGGNVSLGIPSATAMLLTAGSAVELRQGGNSKILTATQGGDIRGNLNNAVGGNQDARLRLQNQSGSDVGLLGFLSTATLHVRNENHGGNLVLEGENSSGVNQFFFIANSEGAVSLYHNGLLRVETQSNGIQVLGSLSNAEGGIQDAQVHLENSLGTELGLMGFLSTPNLHIRSQNHGGTIILEAETSGDVLRNLIVGNPASNVTLYYAGVERFETEGSGIVSLKSNGNSDTETRFLQLLHQDGTARGFMGHPASNHLHLRNQIHGGQVIIGAEDAGGVLRTLFLSDPDAGGGLYRQGLEVARTVTAANGGFEVNNTSTGSGFERVLTESDLGGGFNAAQTATFTVNNTDSPSLITGMSVTTPSLSIGDTLVVEIYLRGDQPTLAAGVRTQLDVTSGAVAGQGTWEFTMWNGASVGVPVTDGYQWHIQNNVISAVELFDTNGAGASVNDAWTAHGYAVIEKTALNGPITVQVKGAQKTATVGNTRFLQGWMKILKV